MPSVWPTSWADNCRILANAIACIALVSAFSVPINGDVKPKAIILEPFSRNTAPAVTIAALKSIEYRKDQILLVLSSDHLIRSKDKY